MYDKFREIWEIFRETEEFSEQFLEKYFRQFVRAWTVIIIYSYWKT